MKNSAIIGLFLVVALLLLVGCTQPAAPANPNPPVQPALQPVVTPIDIETTGSLEITVKNSQGVLLENAVVDIFLEEEGVESESFQSLGRATTNAVGVAKFNGVLAGEIYVSAADSENVFQAVSGEIDVEAGETASLVLTLSERGSEPNGGSSDPQAVDLSLESDDKGFYLNGVKTTTFSVASETMVNLTITQRTTQSVFGGTDIKSAAFVQFNVPNGQSRTVSFVVAEPVTVGSFWPSSNTKKTDLTITPQ